MKVSSNSVQDENLLSVPSLDQVTKWKSYKDGRLCPRSFSVNLVGRDGVGRRESLKMILCTVAAPCVEVAYPGMKHKEMKKEAAVVE